MPSWNSAQYLKFERERTQPATDLAARVTLESPARVIDLGCGPGNSTAVLARRWPNAGIAGLDASTAMLAAARRSSPRATWIETDIATWCGENREPFDMVFSNAALQWVPDHGRIFPRLLAHVARNGALAVQMPANPDALPHRLMRELAASDAWRRSFASLPREWSVHSPEFYYDLLAPEASRLELWCTDYLHVLEGIDGIVEWYRGTGLRPWLDALPDEAARTRFVAEYRSRLTPHFSPRIDGRILFPFRRLFILAFR